ncbi:cation transporter [Burkholderia plantarii]|nr:cation transporter [Burkholderia plantarii]
MTCASCATRVEKALAQVPGCLLYTDVYKRQRRSNSTSAA